MPINLKGKQYFTVAERLTAALGDGACPVGIASILSDVQVAGPAVVVVSTITFENGSRFTGISQARFDATSGADATNPVECAETSAVGRALAMAGYMGSEGIASKEEIEQARRLAGQRRQPPPDVPREIKADTERIAPSDAMSKLHKRYAVLSKEADGLGVQVFPVPHNADEDEITEMGIDLKQRIDEAKRLALAPVIEATRR